MTYPSPTGPRAGISRRAGLGLLLGLLAGRPRAAYAASLRMPVFEVYFPPNAAALSPEAMTVIQDAKTYFDASKSAPQARGLWCNIIGGVDGLEFANGMQRLSRERAATVGRALGDLGLAPGARFLTRRDGPAPFAPGRPNAAEAFNRAVWIELHDGMAPIVD